MLAQKAENVILWEKYSRNIAVYVSPSAVNKPEQTFGHSTDLVRPINLTFNRQQTLLLPSAA